jgi:hypothetical protein
MGTGIEKFGLERISMRFIITRTVLLVVLSVLATGVARAQTDPYQWVGNTSIGYTCGDGFLLMTTQCRADFGPGTRMCKSEEIMDSDTLNPNGIPMDGCWLRPSWRPHTNGDNIILALDESGVVGAPSSLTCGGWRNAGLGLTIQPDGSFTLRSASETRPVACCKPTPVAEPSAALSLPIGAMGLVGLSMLKGSA